MLSEPDDAEARVVPLVAPVDGDGERGELFDRPGARQRTDVDGAQPRELRHEFHGAAARGIGVAADELVAVERLVHAVDEMRRNRLEGTSQGNPRRPPGRGGPRGPAL